MSCEHCGPPGTVAARWLGGNTSLGRCVCVTPENMRALDLALEDAKEPHALAEAFARLSDEERSVAFDLLTEEEQQAVTAPVMEHMSVLDGMELEEALSDYLVSIDLPARPTGAVGNPALERLLSLVFT